MQTNAAEEKHVDHVDYAHTLARMAAVERSYVVYPESPAIDDLGQSVATLSEACCQLHRDKSRTLAVVFEWKLGSASGIDAILYSRPAGFAPSRIFVEQTINNAVNEKIASALHREHPKRTSFRAAA
jgi:hypothetical protein